MVVLKADNTVRIFRDHKPPTVSISLLIEDEEYILPTTQDLCSALVGSKVFSELDLSHVYAQLNEYKESQEYLTIATHQKAFIPT